MRRWEDSTFVFISTNPVHAPGGVEERWLAVMRALKDNGACVRFLCLMGSPVGESARAEGIEVDPYILDKWNVIRSRSRLRKYLKRYRPVCAHSTGLEADLLLRWASRRVPEVHVAHTLCAQAQGTRRMAPINGLMRRLDELGMRQHADAVFVESDEIADEVSAIGVRAEHILRDAVDPMDTPRALKEHLDLYRSFMAGRGFGA